MVASTQRCPARHLFDVRIDALSTHEVLDAVDQAVSLRNRLLIGVVNAAKLVRMNHDERLRRAVLGSDLILADGVSVVWASRLLLRRLPERIAGIDLMARMLERAGERGYRVYCLGATQDVIDEVSSQIRSTYPGVKLVGARNGYFSDEEEEGVVREIAAARPDILFVGMTSPKKERFLAKWSAQLDVPVCHGVGGSFDVMVGKVKRAPLLWQRLGMEWFYRIVQEPGRMWRRYAVTNTLFLWMLAGEALRGVRRTLSGAPS